MLKSLTPQDNKETESPVVTWSAADISWDFGWVDAERRVETVALLPHMADSIRGVLHNKLAMSWINNITKAASTCPCCCRAPGPRAC